MHHLFKYILKCIVLNFFKINFLKFEFQLLLHFKFECQFKMSVHTVYRPWFLHIQVFASKAAAVELNGSAMETLQLL